MSARSMVRHFVWLLFLIGYTTSFSGANAEIAAMDKGKQKTSLEEKKQIEPIVLTSKTFGNAISNGDKWLIEFYAPWCSHCSSFMPIYEAIASRFHSKPDLKVSVGKVNGDSERALASRFGVKAYPSFYLIDGYTVYKYEGSRSMESMVRFVESKYREQASIPFLSSPMGPIGMCQGVFLSGAYGAFHVVEWLQQEMGFSPFFAVMILFGTIFIGIFITIVVSAILLTPKEKRD